MQIIAMLINCFLFYILLCGSKFGMLLYHTTCHLPLKRRAQWAWYVYI